MNRRAIVGVLLAGMLAIIWWKAPREETAEQRQKRYRIERCAEVGMKPSTKAWHCVDKYGYTYYLP